MRHRTIVQLVAIILVGGAAARAQTLPPNPTPQQIDSVIQELKTRPVIDNPIIANGELERLEQLENRFRQLEAKAESSLAAEFEVQRTELQRLITEAPTINCTNATAADTVTQKADEVGSNIQDLNTNTERIYPFLRPLSDEKRTCQSVKAALARPELGAALANLAKAVQDEVIASNAVRSKLPALAEAIRTRKDSLTRALQSEQTRTGLQSYLWAVILVIGGLSITAIWVVKTFPIELQYEWVASGQVIQFVTVMILLSVVMALGLSDILKENTLGTLLGGIAGYVLSQGVGRAAAQAVTKATQSAVTTSTAPTATTGQVTNP